MFGRFVQVVKDVQVPRAPESLIVFNGLNFANPVDLIYS